MSANSVTTQKSEDSHKCQNDFCVVQVLFVAKKTEVEEHFKWK